MASIHRDDSNGTASALRVVDGLRCAAALLGLSGVGLGAWGAHGLKNRPGSATATPTARLDNWKTAVSYQLLHAVTIFSISVLCEMLQHKDLDSNSPVRGDEERSKLALGKASHATQPFPMVRWYERAGQCMTVGSIMFSGSIYMLCLDAGPKKLWGPMTPLGGLCLMAGWAILFTTSATRSISGQGDKSK